MEIGPWRVNDHGGLDFAEGGWEEYTHVVYGVSWFLLGDVYSVMLIRHTTPSGSTCWDRILVHQHG